MTDKLFYILAIDGGGIRGVIPAHILKCMKEKLGIDIKNKFDLIAGTSTGAILAAAIVNDVDISKVINLYKKNGELIFKRKNCISLAPYFASIYKKDNLEKIITKTLGDKTLGEIDKPLIIPASDIGNGNLHIFKSSYSKEFIRDSEVLLRDAVLASCSAPIYFDPTRVGEILLADGGLWANNPSLVAVIDARKRLNIKLENIRILSIGTGYFKNSYSLKTKKKWGFINGWKNKKFIEYILDLQSYSIYNQTKLLLDEKQIFRLTYHLNSDIGLDDYSAIYDLISGADLSFTHESKNISDFLSQQP